MSGPQTPRTAKANRDIENIKNSLAAEWGLTFPPLHPLASPLKNAENTKPPPIEQKVHSCIQFLYWAKQKDEYGTGALGFALTDFAMQAPSIVSQWQFKPGADPTVLHSRHPKDSPTKTDFLRKRRELTEEEINSLMACLYKNLKSYVDKVKNLEPYYLHDAVDVRPSVEQPLTPKKEDRSKIHWPCLISSRIV